MLCHLPWYFNHSHYLLKNTLLWRKHERWEYRKCNWQLLTCKGLKPLTSSFPRSFNSSSLLGCLICGPSELPTFNINCFASHKETFLFTLCVCVLKEFMIGHLKSIYRHEKNALSFYITIPVKHETAKWYFKSTNDIVKLLMLLLV